MKRLIIFTLLAALFVTGLDAQKNTGKGEIVYGSTIERQGEFVVADVAVDISGLKLRSQEMVRFTPVITDRDGKIVDSYAPIIIAGPKRYRALMRDIEYGKARFEKEPFAIVKLKRKHDDIIAFRWTLPYGPWLREAELVMAEELSGCVNCEREVVYADIAGILPPVFIPEYRVSFVNSPVEEVKQRSETYVSHINYELNKYQLLRNYKDNAKVLDEVDAVMTQLTNDPDLTVTKFTVTGYASPEGNFEKNRVLSENRAKSFLNYLKEKFGYNVGSIAYEGRGEDWDGLYKIVETLTIPDRDFALSVIKDTKDVAERKRQLQSLSGGETYRYLLSNYYPQLRRNEYEISFIARSFNVEEARGIVATRPQLLSQNELYLVAETYEKGSEQFKDIFRVAGRTFPKDPYANINYSAIIVEEGDAETVIGRLQGVDMPEAYNNLAIAYFQIGATDLAGKYFRMAAESGSSEGAYNLQQFENWKNNF